MADEQKEREALHTALSKMFPFLEALTGDDPQTLSGYCRTREPTLNQGRAKKWLETLDKYYGGALCVEREKSIGHVITAKGREVVARVREAIELVAEKDPKVVTRVRMAAIGYAAVVKVSAAIAKVSEGYALEEVSVELRPYRYVEDATHDLERGELAALFLVRSAESRVDERGFKFTALGDAIRPVLIGPAGRTLPTPERLHQVPWVVPRPHVADWERLLPPTNHIQVPTNFEVVEFVRAGAGCAIFPDVFAREGRIGASAHGLKLEAWPTEALELQFGALTAKHFEQSAFEKEVNFLQDVFTVLGGKRQRK